MTSKQVLWLLDQLTDDCDCDLRDCDSILTLRRICPSHWEMPQFWALFKPHTVDVVTTLYTNHGDFSHKGKNLVQDGQPLVNVSLRWDRRETLLLLGKEILYQEGSHVVAAAAAIKLLQLCLILCNPTDGTPPGFPVPGILQARILEWVAISYSKLFLIQGSNLCLLHWQVGSLPLLHLGRPVVASVLFHK